MIWRGLGYVFIALGLLALSPFTVGIAVIEWWHVWRHGRAPTYFIPEHPESARAWAERMERGRKIQEREER